MERIVLSALVPRNVLITFLTFVFCCPSILGAKTFQSKVINSHGKPLPYVSVEILVYESAKEGEFQIKKTLKAFSDNKGRIKVTVDDRFCHPPFSLIINLSKKGYSGYSTVGLREEYDLAKLYRPEDIHKTAELPPEKITAELKEILLGEYKDRTSKNDPSRLIFYYESAFRPALRNLLQDKLTRQAAIHYLSFVGVPDDLSAVVQSAPKPNRKLDEVRWAYDLNCALLSPEGKSSWKFLERCACGEYEDGWVDAGAIRTLKLIATDQSTAILRTALKKNPDRKFSINQAFEYISTKPTTLSDADLIKAGEKVAQAIKTGDWKGNEAPYFNKQGDKALIDCVFEAGRDRLTQTATFHLIDGKWHLRGVRETMQALMPLLIQSPQ